MQFVYNLHTLVSLMKNQTPEAEPANNLNSKSFSQINNLYTQFSFLTQNLP